jgi:NAD-dependent DNA ligase
VIAGDNMVRQVGKATKLNITILSENEFIKNA